MNSPHLPSLLRIGKISRYATGCCILLATFIPATSQTLPEWKLQKFGSSTDAGSSSNLADTDSDRLPNLLEYALNQDPDRPNVSWATLTLEGNDLCLTYQRRKSALADNTFQCQWASSTAGPWSATGVSETVIADDGAKQTVKARVAASGAARFLKIKVTHAPALPGAPASLLAVSTSSTELHLSWADNASNEAGYKIERRISGETFSGTHATVAVNASTFRDTGLTPGTTYIYRVAATNATGDSAHSNDARITMPALPPATPSSLAGTAISSSQINLSWADNSTSETGFILERRKSGTPSFIEVARPSANETTYSDTTDVVPGWKLYYRIKAYNTGGESAYSAEINVTPPAAQSMPPDNLLVSTFSTSELRLNWDDNSPDETKFEIYRRQSGTGQPMAYLAEVGANVTSYANTGLPSGTKFYYQVRAITPSGTSAFTDGTLATSAAFTIPGAPGGFTATPVSASAINLAWQDNYGGETGYRVERRQSGTSTWNLVSSPGPDSTNASDVGLTSNTLYHYRLFVTNPGGTSSEAAASATTQQSGGGGGGVTVGNLTYAPNEYMQVVSRFGAAQGIPANNFGHPHGQNMASMHQGYLTFVFAPDSGGGPGGFNFYDISNPRNPVLVKSVYEPEGRTRLLREAHSMGFTNSLGGQHVVLQNGKGVEFWDWTDIQNPVRLSQMDIPNIQAGDYEQSIWQLFWQAPYVYAAAGEQGVFIIDASDPRNPRLADGALQNQKDMLGNFRVGPIFAVGNFMFISSTNENRGISIVDISDPKRPTLISTWGSMRDYYSSTFNGGKIYMSGRSDENRISRMTIFDASNRQNINFLSDSIAIPDPQMQYCVTQDQYVFHGCQEMVIKVDVSNPSNPSIVGQGSLNLTERPDYGAVTAIGNLLFVGNDHGTGSALMCHQTAPDTRGPEVNFISPAPGATGQARTSRVGMTMTDNIDLRTVSSSTFIVRPLGGATLSGKYSAQQAVVNFWPDQPLQGNTTYEVIIPAGGMRDWAGNAVSNGHTSTFTTRP